MSSLNRKRPLTQPELEDIAKNLDYESELDHENVRDSESSYFATGNIAQTRGFCCK